MAGRIAVSSIGLALVGQQDFCRSRMFSVNGLEFNMSIIALVRNIAGLRNTEIEGLARTLALYDIAKAERLERLLNIYIQEETLKRQADYKSIQEAV